MIKSQGKSSSCRNVNRVLTGILLLFIFSQLIAISRAVDSPASNIEESGSTNNDNAYSTVTDDEADEPDDSNDEYYIQNRKTDGPIRFGKIVKVQRGTQLNVTCPTQVSHDSESYATEIFLFKWQLFNNSINDVPEAFNVLTSDEEYEQLFSSFQTYKYSTREINSTRFTDSGRYYCLYENDSKGKRYLVKSFVYIIYEDVQLVKSKNDLVELEACTEGQANLRSIYWFSNGILFSDSKHRASLNLNPQTNSLSIKLNETELFSLTYRCQNIENGAFKNYDIECSNCDDDLSPPIISPSKPLASKGSTTTLSCERSSLLDREPDSIFWFKGETSGSLEPDLKNVINNRSNNVLKISNATEKDSGWYYCCLAYSRLSPEERRALLNSRDTDDEDEDLETRQNFQSKNELDQYDLKCSSVKVTVIDNQPAPKSNKSKNILIILISVASAIILVVWIFISYILYQKLQVYKDKQKAQAKLCHNEIYQTTTGADDDDLEGGTRRRLLKQHSESIECLLEQNEIKKWRIPIKQIDFGQVIGQGAFGVVMCARLNSSSTFSIQTPPPAFQGPKRRDTDSGMGSDMAGSLIQFSDSGSVIEDEKRAARDKLNSESSKSPTDNSTDSSNSSRSVAIKKLKENAKSENFYELFKELQLMFQVGHHPCIINLIGFSIENDSLFIVTEYAKYGNLKDFLRKHHDLTLQDVSVDQSVLKKDRLLIYAYQIALGMQFLHSKKVLHRDLAARNILVDDYDSVKIADFGLARNIRSDYYYIQHKDGKVPLKWMSPEALSYNRISKKSDVWSYGVLLWEIYSYGCSPYPSIPIENILAQLTSGYRMEKPMDCDDFIYDVMLNCWQFDPKKRPSFIQLVETFRNHVLNGTSGSNNHLVELAKYSVFGSICNESDENELEEGDPETEKSKNNSLTNADENKSCLQRDTRLASSSSSSIHPSSSTHPSSSSATSSSCNLDISKSSHKASNDIQDLHINDLQYTKIKSLTSSSINDPISENGKSEHDELLGGEIQNERLDSSSINFEFSKERDSATMLLSPTKFKYSKDDYNERKSSPSVNNLKPTILNKTSY